MNYKLIRSKRKTLSLSVDRDGEIVVRAPLKAAKSHIDCFVEKNAGWIAAQQKKHAESKAAAVSLSIEDIKRLKKQASEVLSLKTNYYSDIMQVKCTGVKITSAKTRWGSCNYKNSICYSYRVMLLNDSQQNYIVVHELAHIKQKNHSPLFYREIEKVLPDYKSTIKTIKGFANADLY